MGKAIPILYEDRHYIVFDKPANLLVIPSPRKEKTTLAGLVNQEYHSPDCTRLYPCHRLDRETSGAIIFAKGKRPQQQMMALFKNNGVKKEYIAFIHGRLKITQGRLKSAVRNLERRRFGARARMAFLTFHLERRYKDYTQVRVYPRTGRTNQIRIQFSRIGHPIVGERKYAVAKNYPTRFRRTALHAHRLSWIHPVTKKKVHIQSPLPKDMEELRCQKH
jgi:RluA family pseudouridine synthase